MSGQLTLDVGYDEDDHEDLRSREDDPTPRGVVRACLESYRAALDHIFVPEPRTIFDVGAGCGVWSSEARRLWPRAEITAVEIDERKLPHLQKWADTSITGEDWATIPDAHSPEDEPLFDLAMGNPPFSLLVGKGGVDFSMPARLLRCSFCVLLFHQEQSFKKSRAGAAVLETHPPAAVFSIPGSIRFRRGLNQRGKRYGADSRCYQMTLWVRGHRGPADFFTLPWLAAEHRRWIQKPGTEEPSPELPHAPGWNPRGDGLLAVEPPEVVGPAHNEP